MSVPSPSRPWRPAAAAVGALVLVMALAGCRSIVVHEDRTVTSYATRAVSPTTVTVGGRSVAAVEIRIRDCHTLVGAFPEEYGDVAMRPIADITDADGDLIFSNFHDGPPRPEGSQVISGGTDDAHRIVVPVAGARAPLTIGSGCTAYEGFGSGGPFNTYRLPTCRTSNRTCAASRAGQGEYHIS
ncbi:MAG TPA: hypothetical protein VK507_13120 [Iamia sp.]|nr:hypothetical protein [Iamia sp.]